MRLEPRIRVSAMLRWHGRILLCRHEKRSGDVWLLPGGGVKSGESLIVALARELAEEVGMEAPPVEGPVGWSTRSRPPAPSARSTSSTSSSRGTWMARSRTWSRRTTP